MFTWWIKYNSKITSDDTKQYIILLDTNHKITMLISTIFGCRHGFPEKVWV